MGSSLNSLGDPQSPERGSPVASSTRGSSQRIRASNRRRVLDDPCLHLRGLCSPGRSRSSVYVGAAGRHDRDNRTIRSTSGEFVSNGVLKYPHHSSSQGKTTSDTDVVEARFVDLVPNQKVVFAVDFVSDDPDYDSAMTMRWEVTKADGGTFVEITADNVPDGISPQDHAAGLESSLQKLADYLVK
jgi:hypothetical protein